MPERQLEGCQIMMSMSDSADLGALAMGEQHFQEATKEIARHLLADGATLAYGGDLRKGGLTWLLFDMALTYNQAASPEGGQRQDHQLPCQHRLGGGRREGRGRTQDPPPVSGRGRTDLPA